LLSPLGWLDLLTNVLFHTLFLKDSLPFGSFVPSHVEQWHYNTTCYFTVVFTVFLKHPNNFFIMTLKDITIHHSGILTSWVLYKTAGENRLVWHFLTHLLEIETRVLPFELNSCCFWDRISLTFSTLLGIFDLPTSASWVTVITGIGYYTWL
jgi:hypothetical protein